jgi:hypothetical protein
MDINFILWVIIQCQFVLLREWFQPWPLKVFQFSGCVPVTSPIVVVFSIVVVENFFTFWYDKMLQVHVVYFLPQP